MLARVRGFWSVAALGVALSTSLFGSVHEASACSPPPNGWFPSGISPVPANGVVLLHYACYMECETLPSVEGLVLRNEADELVPGDVVFSQVRDGAFDIAFRPEPGAITAGGVYTAELAGVPTIGGILVAPAVTWNDALVPAENVFEVDYPSGETRCCTGPVDSCDNTPCFRTQVERRTIVTVGWYDELSIEHYQYVFRIGREAIDPATPWSWDGGDVRFELEPTEDSACYVLELKRLADDSVQSFTSRCIDQPDTFTPGLHTTPDEDIAAVLEACDAAPDGYTEAWCDARQPLCETSPDAPGCADLAEQCAAAGAGGAAGATSVAGDGGTAGGGGAAGTAEGPGGKGGSSGAPGGAGQVTGGTTSTGGTHSTSGAGGTTSIPPGAGGSTEGGAPASEAGAAGEASRSKRVLTKGCGCTVPGSGPREPASFVFVGAMFAVALLRRRAASRSGHERDRPGV